MVLLRKRRPAVQAGRWKFDGVIIGDGGAWSRMTGFMLAQQTVD
jgi:hypothetical protein